MSDWDYTREEIAARITYSRLMLYGTLSLSKLLITSANEVRNLRQTKDSEEHYIRPPRQYDLPEYAPNMQVNLSNQRFLRPTRFCNPHAPEIIAMAHHLGAFSKPPYDYVQHVFEFTKEQMLLEILPIDDAAETLVRGTGTCFQLISVFIALCRAAGIPARYKMYAINMIQAWQDVMIDSDPLVKKWYEAMGYFLIEGEGEAFLDGRWVVAHVGPTAERQAAAGLPITRLGEDAIGIWFSARPGTIMYSESMPAGMGAGSRMLQRISPGSMERVNVSVTKQTEHGETVIEAAGGKKQYDEAVRRKAGPKVPTVDLSQREEIVFENM